MTAAVCSAAAKWLWSAASAGCRCWRRLCGRRWRGDGRRCGRRGSGCPHDDGRWGRHHDAGHRPRCLDEGRSARRLFGCAAPRAAPLPRVIGSGWTVVVVVVPVIAEASLRIAMTAPVPTSTMAANTPAVTSSGRYHARPLVVRRARAVLRVRSRTRGRAALRPAGASESVATTANVGNIVDLRPGQCAQGARPEAAQRRRRVRLSSSGLRTARRAAPRAAVSSGCGVVITGTRSCSDSAVVTAGMLAPPPTEATAARSAG